MAVEALANIDKTGYLGVPIGVHHIEKAVDTLVRFKVQGQIRQDVSPCLLDMKVIDDSL